MNMLNTFQGQLTATVVQNHVEYHERVQYTTPRGPVWTQSRTVSVSEGNYRLEFVFDDVLDKLAWVRGGEFANPSDEVIVYSYPFKDYSKFDMRGRLIS
ncbi:hypothetical protein ABHN11_13030 [Brevibacillus centrosporus]|uniref:hypothetical protein n=1 Tax=Brevibacillus centrosporus TaxID=54910 RepID=UPI0039870490